MYLSDIAFYEYHGCLYINLNSRNACILTEDIITVKMTLFPSDRFCATTYIQVALLPPLLLLLLRLLLLLMLLVMVMNAAAGGGFSTASVSAASATTASAAVAGAAAAAAAAPAAVAADVAAAFPADPGDNLDAIGASLVTQPTTFLLQSHRHNDLPRPTIVSHTHHIDSAICYNRKIYFSQRKTQSELIIGLLT